METIGDFRYIVSTCKQQNLFNIHFFFFFFFVVKYKLRLCCRGHFSFLDKTALCSASNLDVKREQKILFRKCLCKIFTISLSLLDCLFINFIRISEAFFFFF